MRLLGHSSIVERLLESPHDISIVVDTDWRGYYVGRVDHPIEEAENVRFDQQNRVTEIGKILHDNAEVQGEFIGMLKLSPHGADLFKEHYHRAKAVYWDQPFQRAQLMQRAYITDLIQEMTNLGVEVQCLTIERGWKEIDTTEDCQKALRDFVE